MSGTFDAVIEGRTALVTGGGGGIGSATALALAEAGLTVHLVDHRRDGADQVAEEIRSRGGRATVHQVDIADEAAVQRLFASLDGGEECDLLINAAGAIVYAPLVELSVEDLHRMIEVNLIGTFLCLREAARRMQARGGGRIVNLASTASFVAPRLAATAYGMTKGGVRQLTTAAAAELGPHGIRVNAVAPGTTRTPFLQGSLDSPERQASAAASIPLGRVAEPEDVVGTILYLASTLSSYVTGQTILVDGGRTTRSA